MRRSNSAKQPVGSATRKRRDDARIVVAGLEADSAGKRGIDRHLHQNFHRLALDRMRDRDARERNALALHLRHLGHVADFLHRRSGLGLALHHPVGIGRGGLLRHFVGDDGVAWAELSTVAGRGACTGGFAAGRGASGAGGVNGCCAKAAPESAIRVASASQQAVCFSVEFMNGI